MVYQCLQCGQAFPGGSSELLKGCPGCGGTRFFFTQKPLDAAERQQKEESSKADLKNVLLGLLADEEEASRAAGRSWKEWLQVDPDAVQEAMMEIRQRADADGETGGDGDADGELVGTELPQTKEQMADLVRAAAEAGKAPQRQATLDEHTPPTPSVSEAPAEDETEEEDPDAPVGTVNVESPGKYNIDVERLMESNPVVVEKDGVFMIHLASVFDTNAGAKRQAPRKKA